MRTAMRLPHGYILSKQLSASSAYSRACIARRQSDGRELLLKAFSELGDESEAAAAQTRELEWLRACAGPGVPEIVDVIPGGSCPVTVFEQIPGVSLKTWVEHELPSVAACVAV